jgi:TolB protein
MDAADDDRDGNGDNLRRLTNDAASQAGLAWSPDGRKIAFASTRDGDSDVYVMDAEASESAVNLTTIANEPVTRFDGQPVFSPDGTRLALTSSRDGNFDIYVMRAEAESPLNVPTNLTNTSAPANSRWPAWSPDGNKIAFWLGAGTGFGSDAEIYQMDVDGTDPINLTNWPGGDITPDWGPTRQHRPS